jgi:hypothetical protein
VVLALSLAACPGADGEQPSSSPAEVSAGDYCEASVEMYCGYYLRCGRMAVDSLDACRTTFVETCNGRYEPHYVSLEQSGLLELSAEGIQACAEHLATVECSQQIFDLDGPCRTMWQGRVPAGGACGLGIEGFVCADGTTCVLGLDLCGTCRPTVGAGERCGDGVHCQLAANCSSGVCVGRALPGQSCADATCVLGARCEAEVCVTDTIVGVGDSCDATRSCAYRAACVGGLCVSTGLYDDPCSGDLPCASGQCDGGVCVPLGAAGAPCDHPAQCVSGNCVSGRCGALPGACFE